MSAAFPTDKDNIIDALDEDYGLGLTDEECDRLRKMTSWELFFITSLMARAMKHVRAKLSDD